MDLGSRPSHDVVELIAEHEAAERALWHDLGMAAEFEDSVFQVLESRRRLRALRHGAQQTPAQRRLQQQQQAKQLSLDALRREARPRPVAAAPAPSQQAPVPRCPPTEDSQMLLRRVQDKIEAAVARKRAQREAHIRAQTPAPARAPPAAPGELPPMAQPLDTPKLLPTVDTLAPAAQSQPQPQPQQPQQPQEPQLMHHEDADPPEEVVLRVDVPEDGKWPVVESSPLTVESSTPSYSAAAALSLTTLANGSPSSSSLSSASAWASGKSSSGLSEARPGTGTPTSARTTASAASLEASVARIEERMARIEYLFCTDGVSPPITAGRMAAGRMTAGEDDDDDDDDDDDVQDEAIEAVMRALGARDGYGGGGGGGSVSMSSGEDGDTADHPDLVERLAEQFDEGSDVEVSQAEREQLLRELQTIHAVSDAVQEELMKIKELNETFDLAI